MLRPFRRPRSRRTLVLAGVVALAAVGLLLLTVGSLVLPWAFRPSRSSACT
jgi:hypothetical protein